MIIPKPLHRGDTIALLTPATVVKPEYVDGAEQAIRNAGYRPLRMPHFATGADGSFAGSAEDRLADILAAWSNPEVKAIWCGRGGYGSVQLISSIPASLIRFNPKWLIGFSDISALHSMLQHYGVASLHASMLRRLCGYTPGTDYILDTTLSILQGTKEVTLEGDWHPLAQPGIAHGILLGGNLAVLSDLAATPFDIYAMTAEQDVILFFEDIAESISRVERRLWRLRLSGTLNKAKGLIFGLFTAYEPNANFRDMEQMISTRLHEWNIDIPVAFRFPCGHDTYNLPLCLGAPTTLEVGNAYTLLRQKLQPE